MKAFEEMERSERKKKETQGTKGRITLGGGAYQSVRDSTDEAKMDQCSNGTNNYGKFLSWCKFIGIRF